MRSTGAAAVLYTDVAVHVSQECWWRCSAEPAVQLTGAGLPVLATASPIQPMTVQPRLVKGESEPWVLWSQHHPHGLFAGAGGTRPAIRYVARGFGLVGVLGFPVLGLLAAIHRVRGASDA